MKSGFFPAIKTIPLFCALPVLLVPVLASQDPSTTWHSKLYDPEWDPNAPVSFATDKFIQDFSYAGYQCGEKRPSAPSTSRIFNVVAEFGADPSGMTDATSAIQSAIDAASVSGGVVFIPAGHYRLSVREAAKEALRISASGVVLRGAGSDKTFLLNATTKLRNGSIIAVRGSVNACWKKEEKPVSAITGDLSGPTRRLPVADVSGFSVGDVVIVRSDTTQEWVKERGQEDWLGYEHKIGNIEYLRRITSIDHAQNVLTIDVPTRYTLKVRDHARVTRKTGMIREVGLEDFSVGNVENPGTDGWLPLDYNVVGHNGYDVHASCAIRFVNVIDGWARNISSFAAPENSFGSHILSNGILLKECRGVTVENCFFQRPEYGGGGGNGYMFRLHNTSECLLRDCRSAFARHGYSISGMGSSGNVLLRCEDNWTGRQAAPTTQGLGKGSDSHMFFSQSNLFDSCVVRDSWLEARFRKADPPYKGMTLPTHNLTSTHTVFWNTKSLSDPAERLFVVWSQQADYGYVIGTSGSVTAVKTDGPFPEETLPVDFVEGVGQGATLLPQSLYEDQLARRLKIKKTR